MFWPETVHRDTGAADWAWGSRIRAFYYAAAAPTQGPSQAQGIWLREGLSQADVYYRLVLST